MTDEELFDASKAFAHSARLLIMQALTGMGRNFGEIDDGRLAKVVDAAVKLGRWSARPTPHSRQPAPGVTNFAKLA